MVERAANRAGRAVDQGGRELGAHAVDARPAQPRRFLEELDVLQFRGDVRLLLTDGVGPGLGQNARVVGGPAVPVGFGPDGAEFLAGLVGLVTLAAQLGALLAPGRGFPPGPVDLGGQRGRGLAGGRGGLVLVGRLPGQRPQRLQAAELRDVLLARGPQLGRGGRWCRVGLVAGLGPGLLLGRASLGEHAAGSFGLG